MVERSPEKAGVGGSTPSLATTFSITCVRPQACSSSILFQKSRGRASIFPQRADQLKGMMRDSQDLTLDIVLSDGGRYRRADPSVRVLNPMA